MVLLCQAVGICSRTGIILAGRFSLRIICIMLGFILFQYYQVASACSLTDQKIDLDMDVCVSWSEIMRDSGMSTFLPPILILRIRVFLFG